MLLQPREETYPSGARDAVQSGALTRYGVAAAAGAHVHPTVPAGTVVLHWNLGDPSPRALIDASAPVTEVRVETTS